MKLFILFLKLFFPAVIGLGAVGLMLRFWYLGKKSRETSPQLGLVDGHLRICGIAPNAVSSQAMDIIHSVHKIEIQRPFLEERDRLIMILTVEMEGRIKTADENYIHLEFHSRFFGLIDDLEIFAESPTSKSLEIRSASRAGQSDWGVNRKRVEMFRFLVYK